MRPLLLSLRLYACCACIILISACTSTAIDRAVQFISPYFQDNGDGGGIRLAILESGGQGLSATEQLLLNRIRAVLVYDFTCFSNVVLVDQEQLDAFTSSRFKEHAILSNEESVSIGMLTSAQYILQGSVIKVEEGRFRFQVNIVDIDNNTKAVSYTALVSYEELWTLQAVQSAFIDCASQIGIALSEKGVNTVNTLESAGIKGALAYAAAMDRRKSGDMLEELHYLHCAVNQEPLLDYAQKRLAVLPELALQTEKYRQWNDLLIDFERFYENLILFDIVHTNAPVIDYYTGEVEFFVSLCRNEYADAMQDVIKDIKDALSFAPEYEETFRQWPMIPALAQDKSVSLFSINDYIVEFGLYNSSGEFLSQTRVLLQSQTVFFEREVLTDSTQQYRGSFPSTAGKAPDEGSFIKVLSINNVDREKSRINIISVNTLPPVRKRAAYFNQTPVQAMQGKEQEQPAQPEAALKWLDWFRFGIGAGAYFLNESENVINGDPNSLQGIVALGVKWITVEAFIHSSYNSITQSLGNNANAPLGSEGDTISYGLGADFTLMWRSFMFSLGGGYTHYTDKADSLFMQVKADLVPDNFGLGLRVGYKADLFDMEQNAIQFNGKVIAGLLFWL